MTEQLTPAAPGSPQIPELTLGWRIQLAIHDAGIKVEDLAAELDVSRSTISRWMHDDAPVRKVFLQRIALRTGVPYEWLRTGEVPSAPTDPTGADTTDRYVADSDVIVVTAAA